MGQPEAGAQGPRPAHGPSSCGSPDHPTRSDGWLTSRPAAFSSAQTSLASRALDALSDSPSLPSAPASAEPKHKNRAEVVAALLKYLDTDTICFHEEKPWRLVKLQDERWVPILDWVKEAYGCDGALPSRRSSARATGHAG